MYRSSMGTLRNTSGVLVAHFMLTLFSAMATAASTVTLVVGLTAIFDAQAIILKVNVQRRQDQLII